MKDIQLLETYIIPYLNFSSLWRQGLFLALLDPATQVKVNLNFWSGTVESTSSRKFEICNALSTEVNDILEV